MNSFAGALSAALGAAALAACSGAGVKYDAARDVHAFIVSVRADDAATFERHLDRPALRAQVLGEVRSAAAGESGPPADLLGSSMAESAADQLIRPETFLLALERAGAPDRTPTAAEIATQLRLVEGGRVCLPRSADGPCVATFAETGEVWKLVAIDIAGAGVGPGVGTTAPGFAPPGTAGP